MFYWRKTNDSKEFTHTFPPLKQQKTAHGSRMRFFIDLGTLLAPFKYHFGHFGDHLPTKKRPRDAVATHQKKCPKKYQNVPQAPSQPSQDENGKQRVLLFRKSLVHVTQISKSMHILELRISKSTDIEKYGYPKIRISKSTDNRIFQYPYFFDIRTFRYLYFWISFSSRVSSTFGTILDDFSSPKHP